MLSKILLVGILLLSPMFVFAQQGLVRVRHFDGTSQRELPEALYAIINTFLILAAIVAAIFIIIGGIRYITTGDDEDGQRKAKNTILYAVIGLIVIGLAATITNFTLRAIAGGGFPFF